MNELDKVTIKRVKRSISHFYKNKKEETYPLGIDGIMGIEDIWECKLCGQILGNLRGSNFNIFVHHILKT